MSNEDPFVLKSYYFLTFDPVYVGTGGYRLGRVDNTIVREPGTNIPKIPGSSISGVVRAYTAMAIQSNAIINEQKDHKINYKEYLKCKYLRPAYQFKNINGKVEVDNFGNAVIITGKDGQILYDDFINPIKPKYHSCAGKGTDDGEGHCGQPDCPVCIAFGFSKGKSKISFQGLVQFFDARILFFPVHSMLGPVWITCPSILKDFKDSLFKSDDQITIDLSNISDFDNSKYFIQTELIQKDDSLNLGWIYLQNNNNLKPLLENDELNKLNINKEILNRLVLVPDKLFSQIVNDNLEVRTSNAIDPATGAAEDGALYSYEAIPRATVMWFDVVYNKPEYFKVPVIKNGKIEQEDIKEKWDWLKENVEKGFSYFEYLGIGGMGTRGMGRIKILNLKDQDNKENNNTSKTNKETNDDINNQN